MVCISVKLRHHVFVSGSPASTTSPWWASAYCTGVTYSLPVRVPRYFTSTVDPESTGCNGDLRIVPTIVFPMPSMTPTVGETPASVDVASGVGHRMQHRCDRTITIGV